MSIFTCNTQFFHGVTYWVCTNLIFTYLLFIGFQCIMSSVLFLYTIYLLRRYEWFTPFKFLLLKNTMYLFSFLSTRPSAVEGREICGGGSRNLRTGGAVPARRRWIRLWYAYRCKNEIDKLIFNWKKWNMKMLWN